MVDSRIDAVDTLNEVVSSMVGASYALCYKATIEGDELSSLLTRVLDVSVDALREIVGWLESEL
ncbi:MAG: hypothetical protein IJG88_00055 [Eggerthellaceae bacterium]|nr:hypothetical protein [Eggerthellaceae bacterium]